MNKMRCFMCLALALSVTACLPGGNEAVPGDFAENLEIPWEIAFLPGGDALVTERPGRLRRVGEVSRVYQIEGVHHEGEGGLLGLALHPDFPGKRYLYLYITYAEGNEIFNRVDRYIYRQSGLTGKETVLGGIPGGRIHNGGRIAFGPDGFLYITTGDAGDPPLAQEKDSLAGKILRIGENGEIPEHNPFSTPVYSLGHRNPQGLAWDSRGRLWSTEHGATGNDELNLIEEGKNYGWPVIEGAETRKGMAAPVLHSGSDTWAPSGAAYLGGSVFFAGLRGRALYEAVLDQEAGEVRELVTHRSGQFGRLRSITSGPDGRLYILTSNRDGRGVPAANDDRVIGLELKEVH